MIMMLRYFLDNFLKKRNKKNIDIAKTGIYIYKLSIRLIILIKNGMEIRKYIP